MTLGYGGQNMVAPLRRVVVRRPDPAFAVSDPRRWHYVGRPDLGIAQSEHDRLVDVLRSAGAEIHEHGEALPDLADAIYVHDPILITDGGAIVLRMGKELRRGEEEALERTVAGLGVPTRFRLHGAATAEAGDLLWLDQNTLAAGRSFRTNAQGISQLREQLAPDGVEVVDFDLPCFAGEHACLHLMSVISMVDYDLAVIYPRLLPVALWEALEARGIQRVEVPDEEFPSMGPNVLALAPRRCLMLRGNPITAERLRAAGCEVSTYKGDELSLKAEGGPTCLTRPLLRG